MPTARNVPTGTAYNLNGGRMKKFAAWRGTVVWLLIIGAMAWAWAWVGKDISVWTISRGLMSGGVTAMVLGLANLRMGSGYVNQNSPSYSTAFYNTLEERKKLMFEDMAEGWSLTKNLLVSG